MNSFYSWISYNSFHLLFPYQVTYEENQKIKLRQEGEKKRQEAKKREEDKKRAEEKKKEEELLAMLEEEKLLCNIDLEEDECASDIEVRVKFDRITSPQTWNNALCRVTNSCKITDIFSRFRKLECYKFP